MVRPIFDGVETIQLQQLRNLIGGLVLTTGTDRWAWKYELNGIFNVASLKKILSSVNRIRLVRIFEWNNWVSKKVGFVAWRAEMERLPTKHALSVQNVPVLDQMCVLCGDCIETSEHIFVSCQFAQMIWQNLAGWCMIPPIFAFGINGLLTLHETSSGSRKMRKALHAVALVTFWSLWKSRNEAVFGQIVPNSTKLLEEIKAMAYLWVKNRSRMATLSCEDWSRFNLGS
ncbi:uncharacterized protein LOC110892933 [Helianthus annuus]|uniref:uncharacterized protein LOC110892933 n=1 Tax=Helianthus annuus TaxID=4232 RepID=UPI000B8F9FC2|nr:uncharacterized protein LOC110892933 [Helianthus annuus]